MLFYYKKHDIFSHLERFTVIDKSDKITLLSLEAIYA